MTKIIAGINVEIQIICPLGAVTECGQNIPPCSIMGNIKQNITILINRHDSIFNI